MNILIIGTGEIEQRLINLCQKSKFLDKIFTASNKPLENIPNIEYKNYEDLSIKIKSLYIDVVLLADKSLIEDGIVEFLKKRMINVISTNKKWLNLETSRIIAKQLMNYYSINNPNIIKAPLSFPIVVRENNQNISYIAHTLDELIQLRENLKNNDIFLEDYLDGEVRYLTSLWDGKSLYNLPLSASMTEVQEDRLDLYKTKLTFMLADEKPDFVGFFTTKIIWAKNDWYVLDYIMHLDKNAQIENIPQDFLFIINSAIYQNLNEIL